MNKRKKEGFVLCLALILFAITFVLALPAESVYVNPISVNQTRGDNFTINVDINTTHEVYAADITLYFNNSILNAAQINEGNFLNSDGADTYCVNSLDNSIGIINFSCSRVGDIPGISGNGTLFSVDFTALSFGLSNLSLQNIIFVDENLDEVIGISIVNGSVNITNPNNIPTLYSITITPETVKGGGNIVVSANNADDLDNDTLSVYCSTNSTPSISNNSCSASGFALPYNINCSGTALTGDTNHTIYCRLYDGKDYSEAKSNNYTDDSTPPAISIQKPENMSYAVNSLSINITSDDSQACWYNFNSAENISLINSSVTNWFSSANISFQERRNTLQIYCNDSVGNENNITLIFNVDTIKPSISIDSPLAVTYNAYSINLNWTYSDLSPLSWAGYSLNGNPNVSLLTYEQDNENSYSCSGDFNSSYPCSSAVDENWNSYAEINVASYLVEYENNIYENFTVPSGTTSANWTFKFDYLNLSSNYKSINDYFKVYYWDYNQSNWLEIFTNVENQSGSYNVSIPADGLNQSQLKIKTVLKSYWDNKEPSNLNDDIYYFYRYYEGKVIWFGIFNRIITASEGLNTLTVYANDSVGNMNSRTIEFTVNTSSSGSPAGGGGGGGGGGSSTPTYNLGNLNENEEKTAYVEAGSIILFNLTKGDRIFQHWIKLTGMTANSVNFIIYSPPLYSSLNTGEIKNYDLDESEGNDISITLNKLQGGMVNLTVKNLLIASSPAEEKPSPEKNETGGRVPTTTGQTISPLAEKSNKKIFIISLLVVLMAVISSIVLLRKKNAFPRKRRRFVFLFILAFAFMLLLIPFSSASSTITSCMELNKTGEIYYLNADILNSSVAVCMDVTAENVILDCQGNKIGGKDNLYSIGIYSNRFNTTIKNCVLTRWYDGIDFDYPIDDLGNPNPDGILKSTITNVISQNNLNYGIWLYSSLADTDVIFDNLILNDNYEGLVIAGASDNIFTNITTRNNVYGIVLSNGANNNILVNITAKNNVYGIELYGFPVENNIIRDSIIEGNDYGIYFYEADISSMLVYNNFFNNTNNVHFDSLSTVSSFWNTTKTAGINILNKSYIGGNVWLKPDETGFSQNITACNPGSDGFCSNSFTLSAGNIDYLPLHVNDTKFPLITINSPANAVYNNLTQLINITSFDVYLNSVWFSNGTYTETYNKTPIYRNFSEGLNTLTVYANDTSGNTNSTSVSFTIDTISPSVYLQAPLTNLSNQNMTVIFIYNVTDVSNIKSCSLYINDILNQTNKTEITKGANQSFMVNLTRGNYNWSVNCVDAANNIGVSTKIIFELQLICSDGTLYDSCSADQPAYCDNGILINRCDICSCGSGYLCKTDLTCESQGGGGGSSSGGCLTDWTCTGWNNCANSIQIRTCSKLDSNCYANPTSKPSESQSCTMPQTPSEENQEQGTSGENQNGITGQVIRNQKGNLNLIIPLVIFIWIGLTSLIIHFMVKTHIKNKKNFGFR